MRVGNHHSHLKVFGWSASNMSLARGSRCNLQLGLCLLCIAAPPAEQPESCSSFVRAGRAYRPAIRALRMETRRHVSDTGPSGHRDRLRARFVAGEGDAHSDERMLELLLSYAIPRRDVASLAQHLIAEFGSIQALLTLTYDQLCALDGVGPHTAILFRLVRSISQQVQTQVESPDVLARHAGQLALLMDEPSSGPEEAEVPDAEASQPDSLEANAEQLVEEQEPESEAQPGAEPESASPAIKRRPGTGLFGVSALDEAINQLPHLPDTDSLDEVREFLMPRLPFSSEQTRHRNANYIMRRMFPQGIADRAMRTFARCFAGRQELSDACFYRFCKTEELIYEVVDDVMLPAVGRDKLRRSAIKDYLDEQFPDSRSTSHCATAIVNALAAAGIVEANRTHLRYGYRHVLLPSFAFVLHSEFPSPGMYDIGLFQRSPAVRAMLWHPDRIVPMLYELRNAGIISKVSEIDTVRQFSTKWNLDEVVDHLVTGG